jgi:mono/diheme cytochrome c family protein
MKRFRRGFAAAAMAFMTGAGALAMAGMPTPAMGAETAGQALFQQRCAMCHQTIGMGVAILSRRPGDASKGVLEQRADLSAAFVKAAVRNGIANMPRIARGEVSDPELAAIATYLSRGKP